jgi:hypothetical protein
MSLRLMCCLYKQNRIEQSRGGNKPGCLRFFCWLAARKGDCASMGPVWFVHSKSMGVVEGRWLRDMVAAGDEAVAEAGQEMCVFVCVGCGGAAGVPPVLTINIGVPGLPAADFRR